MYKRVLIKLSGEALSGNDKVFDMSFLKNIALQVKKITEMGISVGIVVGGGNICRGRLFEGLGFDRVQADYTGMLATVINAVTVSAAIEKEGVKSKTLSAINAESVEKYSKELANKYLDEGYVLVFGGGVGKPYYSTDTGCAQRALDINADVMLIAKNGCDGVYDKDPNKYSDAKRFNEISFNDILNMKLGVIDLQAAELCSKHSIKAFIFDMAIEDNIVKACKKEAIGTLITTL